MFVLDHGISASTYQWFWWLLTRPFFPARCSHAGERFCAVFARPFFLVHCSHFFRSQLEGPGKTQNPWKKVTSSSASEEGLNSEMIFDKFWQIRLRFKRHSKNIPSLSVQRHRMLDNCEVEEQEPMSHANTTAPNFPECLRLSEEKGLKFEMRSWWKWHDSLLPLTTSKTSEASIKKDFVYLHRIHVNIVHTLIPWTHSRFPFHSSLVPSNIFCGAGIHLMSHQCLGLVEGWFFDLFQSISTVQPQFLRRFHLVSCWLQHPSFDPFDP